MITFIWVFAAIILAAFFYFIARSSGQRKRLGQSSRAEVNAERDGGGKPTIGRASGSD